MNSAYVYILGNRNRTVLYVGYTRNIERRMLEHKCLVGAKFTLKYKATYLLYFEELESAKQAIERERQLKNWRRSWKLDLIKTLNPHFEDLAKDWFDKDELESF